MADDKGSNPTSFSKRMMILAGAFSLLGGDAAKYSMSGISSRSWTAGRNKYAKKPEPLTDEDLRHNADIRAKKAAKRARQEAKGGK